MDLFVNVMMHILIGFVIWCALLALGSAVGKFMLHGRTGRNNH